MPPKKKSKSTQAKQQKGKKTKRSTFTKNLMAGILSVSKNYIELQKLIDQMAGKVSYINKDTQKINQNTVRVTGDNLKTKVREFVFTDGKDVKGGIDYHIHYTKDLKEHYMTQKAYNNVTSKLIFPVKKTSTFSIYNDLNKQSPMILKSDAKSPTDKDYVKGFMTRYFAKKANEVMSKPFEISAKYVNKSPLYIYTTFKWFIYGPTDRIESYNSRTIEKVSKVMPNIGKYLSPFQFYRKNKALNKGEAILEKLGVIDYSEMKRTELTIAGASGTMGAGLVAMMKKSSGKKKRRKSGKTKSKKKY